MRIEPFCTVHSENAAAQWMYSCTVTPWPTSVTYDAARTYLPTTPQLPVSSGQSSWSSDSAILLLHGIDSAACLDVTGTFQPMRAGWQIFVLLAQSSASVLCFSSSSTICHILDTSRRTPGFLQPATWSLDFKAYWPWMECFIQTSASRGCTLLSISVSKINLSSLALAASFCLPTLSSAHSPPTPTLNMHF